MKYKLQALINEHKYQLHAEENFLCNMIYTQSYDSQENKIMKNYVIK